MWTCKPTVHTKQCHAPFFRSAELSNCLWQLEKARGYQGTAANATAPSSSFFPFVDDVCRSRPSRRHLQNRRPFSCVCAETPPLSWVRLASTLPRVFMRKNRTLFGSLYSPPLVFFARMKIPVCSWPRVDGYRLTRKFSLLSDPVLRRVICLSSVSRSTWYNNF